jgi:hypothetical protein
VHAVSVLFRCSVAVEFVAFVAAEFPCFVEVSPQLVDEFLGPCFAGVFGWSFTVAVALLLTFDDRCGDLTAKEVLPSNCLLLDGCAEQWVSSGKLLENAGVAKPLDEALRHEFADGLSSVAGVTEVVHGCSKEVVAFGGSRGVRTSEQMAVAFVDCKAVRASVVFQGIMSMCFMSCGKPLN